MADKTNEVDLIHIDNEALAKQISELLDNARKHVATTVNTALIKTYWDVGRLIYDDVQNEGLESLYATHTIKNISKRLTRIYGKGYSVPNLYKMIIF